MYLLGGDNKAWKFETSLGHPLGACVIFNDDVLFFFFERQMMLFSCKACVFVLKMYPELYK